MYSERQISFSTSWKTVTYFLHILPEIVCVHLDVYKQILVSISQLWLYTHCSVLFLSLLFILFLPSFPFLTWYLVVHPFQYTVILSDTVVQMYQKTFNHFPINVHFSGLQMFAIVIWLRVPLYNYVRYVSIYLSVKYISGSGMNPGLEGKDICDYDRYC